MFKSLNSINESLSSIVTNTGSVVTTNLTTLNNLSRVGEMKSEAFLKEAELDVLKANAKLEKKRIQVEAEIASLEDA